MKRLIMAVLVSLAVTTGAFAQAPAAAKGPATKIGMIDFNRAVTDNDAGKKAKDEIMAALNQKQADFQAQQKIVDDATKQLTAQEKTITDAQRTELNRKITQANTTMQRINDDAQQEAQDLQDRLFSPIADRVTAVVKAYGTEVGLAAIFNVSEQGGVLYFDDVVDVTTEIIRRTNADLAKDAKPAAAAPAAASRPAGTPPPSAARPPAAAAPATPAAPKAPATAPKN